MTLRHTNLPTTARDDPRHRLWSARAAGAGAAYADDHHELRWFRDGGRLQVEGRVPNTAKPGSLAISLRSVRTVVPAGGCVGSSPKTPRGHLTAVDDVCTAMAANVGTIADRLLSAFRAESWLNWPRCVEQQSRLFVSTSQSELITV